VLPFASHTVYRKRIETHLETSLEVPDLSDYRFRRSIFYVRFSVA
jgi:hypothetical protein